MFCGNCGNQIPDDSTFCPHCGQKIEQATYNQTQSVQVRYNQPKETHSKSKKAPLLSAVIALIVIVGVLFAILGNGNSPEKVSEEYVKAYYDYDMEKTFELSAFDVDYNDIKDLSILVIKEYLFSYYDTYGRYLKGDSIDEYLLDQYGTNDINEVVEIVINHAMVQQSEDRNDIYGPNVTMTCKAIKKADLTKTKIRSLVSEINASLDSMREAYPGKASDLAVLDDMYVNVSSISDACEVTVMVYIKGEIKSGEEEYEFTLAKVDGKWKVIDAGNLSYGLFEVK